MIIIIIIIVYSRKSPWAIGILHKKQNEFNLNKSILFKENAYDAQLQS